ncbi:hypothetical protein [Paenibacillus dendritiformis]|uniref:hypothetical protein n=1 Tax=Paenibacillus dendritiformis TaxID=130049 RepID=UPI0020C48C01|nr:hypothetical protein [Paenibacillus dendritiformis]CAH8770628.1 hypothetical protein H7S4_003363 [Paenibacillus dendritiformis]
MVVLILILIFINTILGRSHSGGNGQTKAIFCTKSKALPPPSMDRLLANSLSGGPSAKRAASRRPYSLPFSFAQNKMLLYSTAIEKPVFFYYNNH